MVIIGVDVCHLGGVVAVVVEDGVARLIDAIDIATVGINSQRRVDPHAVRHFIQKHSPQLAAIERTQAFPAQGRSSIYSFARAAGTLETVIALCDIPIVMIEPAKWKKHFRLARDKEASRQMALRLFPAAHALLSKKKDHGKAEAALIATYVGGRS
jgi:crossover junction endodeoxyribonuclease RuvC